MTRLELLSPAKNEAAARAAIANGADAVYIGAPAFGARAAAGNHLADIARVVANAHRYNARVFVALNTILHDSELPEAERLARDLADTGVDALIVQDMAMLQIALPPIPLHASTQMHNYDLERVKFLDRLGFRRVILARELSIDQIRTIRREVSAELECFVHGALCVGLSGQCYISRFLTGRSANRGECAQPCRARWTATDDAGRVLARDKHLLSLKDLNLSDHLPELIDAGVTSFKIEGRLKEPSYVANVTRHYSLLLDAETRRRGIARASSGEVTAPFQPDPARSFNRGFTTYFFSGRQRGMINADTPKSVGKRVARVTGGRDGRLTVDALEPIHNADGLCYLEGGELKGFLVNSAEANRLLCNDPVSPPPGTWLYRNHDHAFETLLERRESVRAIAVDIEVRADAGHLLLSAVDEDGTRASVRSDERLEPATRPGNDQQICRQVSKCGGTAFRCRRVFYVGDPLFAPASLVNRYRRLLLDDLSARRSLSRERWVQEPWRVGVPLVIPARDGDDPREDYRRLNIANALSRQFYRASGVVEPPPFDSPGSSRDGQAPDPSHRDGKVLDPPLASESPGSYSDGQLPDPSHREGRPLDPPLAFESPDHLRGQVVMRSRYCLLFEWDMCLKHGNLAPPKLPLYLSNPLGRFRLEFDCAACFMNVIALSR